MFPHIIAGHKTGCEEDTSSAPVGLENDAGESVRLTFLLHRCLIDEPGAWTRLVDEAREPLRRHCARCLARNGQRDPGKVDEASQLVLSSLPVRTGGGLRKYLAGLGAYETPCRATFNAYLGRLGRCAVGKLLRSERRIHARERKAARREVQPPSVSEEQVGQARAEAFWTPMPSAVLQAFWFFVLDDMPAEVRDRALSGPLRMSLSRLYEHFQEKMATGKIGGNLV